MSEFVANHSPLWLRRLPDGRCLVLGVLRECQLPDNVNDAVVETTLVMGKARDATQEGKGRDFIDIIQCGWKGVSRATTTPETASMEREE
jgi:hypothetical protein